MAQHLFSPTAMIILIILPVRDLGDTIVTRQFEQKTVIKKILKQNYNMQSNLQSVHPPFMGSLYMQVRRLRHRQFKPTRYYNFHSNQMLQTLTSFLTNESFDFFSSLEKNNSDVHEPNAVASSVLDSKPSVTKSNCGYATNRSANGSQNSYSGRTIYRSDKDRYLQNGSNMNFNK